VQEGNKEEARDGAEEDVEKEIVGEDRNAEGMLPQSSNQTENAQKIGEMEIPAEVTS